MPFLFLFSGKSALEGSASPLQAVFSAVSDGWIVQYSIVITSTLIVCEYIATLHDEIRLIWPSRLSIAKVLFNLNRYVPFITNVLMTYFMLGNRNELMCRRGFFAAGVFACFQYVIAEAILFIRAYAIWGRGRIVGAILASVFLVSMILAFVFTITFLKDVVAAPFSAMSNGCSLLFPSKIIWVCMVVLLTCETLSLGVILLRVILRASNGLPPTLVSMFQDGVYYYVLVLIVTIINFFIIFFTRASLRNFLLPAQGVLHSILCNRLLLRTRGAYESIMQQSVSFVTFGQKETVSSTSTSSSGATLVNGVARNWSVLVPSGSGKVEEHELEVRV